MFTRAKNAFIPQLEYFLIELSLKRAGNSYDWDDFQRCIATSRKGKHVIIKDMSASDFSTWLDKHCPSKIKKISPRVYLSQVKRFKAIRGEMCLYYSENHDSNDWKKFDFLSDDVIVDGFQQPIPQHEPKGISSARKNGIINKLTQLMPPRKREFWLSLNETRNSVPTSARDIKRSMKHKSARNMESTENLIDPCKDGQDQHDMSFLC
jgi:hypothetical protein